MTNEQIKSKIEQLLIDIELNQKTITLREVHEKLGKIYQEIK